MGFTNRNKEKFLGKIMSVILAFVMLVTGTFTPVISSFATNSESTSTTITAAEGGNNIGVIAGDAELVMDSDDGDSGGSVTLMPEISVTDEDESGTDEAVDKDVVEATPSPTPIPTATPVKMGTVLFLFFFSFFSFFCFFPFTFFLFSRCTGGTWFP